MHGVITERGSQKLRPMSEFDPLKPAILHDVLNDKLVPWTTEYAVEWMQYAAPFDEGVIGWDGLLIDGWSEEQPVSPIANDKGAFYEKRR